LWHKPTKKKDRKGDNGPSTKKRRERGQAATKDKIRTAGLNAKNVQQTEKQEEKLSGRGGQKRKRATELSATGMDHDFQEQDDKSLKGK